MNMTRKNTFKRFCRKEDGVMLTEFAIVLPFILLVMFLIFESTRIFFSYQAAVDGVRDASRYLARIAPVDICDTGGNVDGFEAELFSRVGSTINGTSAFAQTVTLTGLNASVSCIPGDYRQDPVPIANVSASIRITFPFSGFIAFFDDGLETVNTNIKSDARIFGL